MTDDELRQLVAANATAMAASNERLTRIEAMAERTQQQIDDNARAMVEVRQALRTSIADVADMIATNSQETDRQMRETDRRFAETDRRFAETDQRFAEMAQQFVEVRRQFAETDQRFNNLLNDARADRQKNEQEHRAFRESFQTLLAEITRLWQRLQAS